MKTVVAFLTLVVLLSLVGCSGGDSAVIGKWKGEVKVAPSSDKNNPMAKFAEGLASMLSMDVELKADHNYEMTIMGAKMEGNWSKSGNEVTLTPTKIMGMTVEEFKAQNANNKGATSTMGKDQDPGKAMKLELQGDGTMHAVTPEGESTAGGSLVFTKKS